MSEEHANSNCAFCTPRPRSLSLRGKTEQIRLDVRGFSPTLDQQGSHQRVARHTDILELPAGCEAKNRRCETPVNARSHRRWQ
jgi:hypothetical protein